jgi:hypothetical protein
MGRHRSAASAHDRSLIECDLSPKSLPADIRKVAARVGARRGDLQFRPSPHRFWLRACARALLQELRNSNAKVVDGDVNGQKALG